MGDVISIKRRARDKRKDKARGKTLCQQGFHQWEADGSRPFDVKTGKLVTRYRCRRCEATRTRLT